MPAYKHNSCQEFWDYLCIFHLYFSVKYFESELYHFFFFVQFLILKLSPMFFKFYTSLNKNPAVFNLTHQYKF